MGKAGQYLLGERRFLPHKTKKKGVERRRVGYYT